MNSQFKMKKFEKLFVLEHKDPIYHILEETLKSSQRIKLVCYDISRYYIIFGANNGSVHVYKRDPEAAFLKLIPSKNLAALEQISISPSEENISIIDETECRGKKVTATKWDSDSRLYIGDNEGTVSILSVPNIVSLALLHTPYIELMDLGAPIIQIDTFSRFILITTKRKTFICDTEREMYKQVGRKEKSLGACFFNILEEKLEETNKDYEKYRLYCTRPGLRMWEANFEGEVFYTHNYRDAVPDIYEILRFGKEENAHLESEKVNEVQGGNNRCFGKMVVFNKKYLCVTNEESICIIDPEKNDLVFYKYYTHPIDIRLCNNEIYIWNYSTTRLQVLHFYRFEDLLCEILKCKQYKAGAQLVLKYKKDIVDWSKYSHHVKLLTDLGHKLSNIDKELTQKFEEILQEIIYFEKEQLQKFLQEDDPKIVNINNEKLQEPHKQICKELETIHKQYKLNNSNPMVLIPQFNEMLVNMNGNDMTKLFSDFIEYLEGLNEEVQMEWCYSQFMHHFHSSKKYLKLKQMNPETMHFITKSFLEVNKNYAPGCACGFPLPSVSRTQPKYDIVGSALVEHSDKFKYLLHKIPPLWLHVINKLRTVEDLEENLPLILQFGYIEILEKVSKHVTYDFCDNLIDLFVKLKTGKCLNCGKAFPEENSQQLSSWDYIGLKLHPLIGANNVLKLFLNRHKYIPRNELSKKFYMTCIFSKVRAANYSENGALPNNRSVKMAVKFINNNDTRTEFEDCLSTFLMGKVDKNINAQNQRKALTCSSCRYCKILLSHPVLNQIEILDCGHAFHTICLGYIKRICNVCFSNS